MKRVHFIAIGGAIMHNLALCLQESGYHITGSDDIIYEPSRSRLAGKGLLPNQFGWNTDNINTDLDCIILGKHAKVDNPELLRAQELGVKIYSFPSFIAEHSKDKKRVVVAGSHGKTTTTSMIMHVLKKQNIDHDYLVGAQLEGYDTMVRLSKSAIIIIEGDEYTSSPIDDSPKFLYYKPDIAIVTGIEWDHINVFPSYQLYFSQFVDFIKGLDPNAKIFIDGNDLENQKLKTAFPNKDISEYFPFTTVGESIRYDERDHEIKIFGRHNMSNMKAAFLACLELGVKPSDFFKSMKDFKGAAKRQQLLTENTRFKLFWDFAHAPSKVRETVRAFEERFSNQKITVVLELHTYSSLTKSFLPHYKDSLGKVNSAFIFYNPENLRIKKMEALNDNLIKSAFNRHDLVIFDTPEKLKSKMIELHSNFEGLILILSSGQLGGIGLKQIFNY